MKMILVGMVGMVMMLMMQFIGLMFVDFSELGVTFIMWGIKLLPLSITATIITISLKIYWREKDEDN